MPAEVCDGKTGFDMIKSAIDKTYSATGEMYCIVANHMYIELRRAPIPTRTLLVIDTQNTMSDYTYSESIDNAANVVQVVQKNTDNSQTKQPLLLPTLEMIQLLQVLRLPLLGVIRLELGDRLLKWSMPRTKQTGHRWFNKLMTS